MQNQQSKGILLAILACLLWSGNFIVARAIFPFIPPVTLAFMRWITAVAVLLLIARKHITISWLLLRRHFSHLLVAAITGVVVFNTFLYIAGHYASAVNLALIGTTSSPVFTFLLAGWLLREKISLVRLTGLLICICGIIFLVAKGSWQNLLHLKFSIGDLWVLAAGLIFAFYNIVVRRKPKIFDAVTYLFVTFALGTAILFPAMVVEQVVAPGVVWNWQVVGSILYIGAGASVAAFFCWNAAIGALGAARTSIFGNLIPVFSSIEAVIILHERIEWFQLAGMLIVGTGLVLANISVRKKGKVI